MPILTIFVHDRGCWDAWRTAGKGKALAETGPRPGQKEARKRDSGRRSKNVQPKFGLVWFAPRCWFWCCVGGYPGLTNLHKESVYIYGPRVQARSLSTYVRVLRFQPRAPTADSQRSIKQYECPVSTKAQPTYSDEGIDCTRSMPGWPKAAKRQRQQSNQQVVGLFHRRRRDFSQLNRTGRQAQNREDASPRRRVRMGRLAPPLFYAGTMRSWGFGTASGRWRFDRPDCTGDCSASVEAKLAPPPCGQRPQAQALPCSV